MTTHSGDASAGGPAYADSMDVQLSPIPSGTPAPEFTLSRSSNAVVSLTDLRGHRVILVFYPADWEPVSRQQLMLYQDFLPEFDRFGALLLAISTDHVWCHSAFARASGIEYPLLSDAHPPGSVSRAYGAYDERAGASSRTLFVLDESGVIRWSQASPTAVNPGVGGILTALEFLVQPESAFDDWIHGIQPHLAT